MADLALHNRLSSEDALNPHGSVVEAIQNSGCLLRFDAALRHVRQVSANLAVYLGIDAETALQSTAKDLLGSKLQTRLLVTLQKQDRLPAALVINRQVRGHYQRFYVMAYRSDNDIVVEFEALSRAGEQRLLPIINEWLTRLAATSSSPQL